MKMADCNWTCSRASICHEYEDCDGESHFIQKLLPCPFCGDSDIIISRYGTLKQSCIIECSNCGSTLESNEIGAGRFWNERNG